MSWANEQVSNSNMDENSFQVQSEEAVFQW